MFHFSKIFFRYFSDFLIHRPSTRSHISHGRAPCITAALSKKVSSSPPTQSPLNCLYHVSISCSTLMCELCHDITVIPMRYCSSETAFRPLTHLEGSLCYMHLFTSTSDKAPSWADVPGKDMRGFSIMPYHWHSLVAVYSLLELTSLTLFCLLQHIPHPLPYLTVGRHLSPCCFVIPNLQLSLLFLSVTWQSCSAMWLTGMVRRAVN